MSAQVAERQEASDLRSLLAALEPAGQDAPTTGELFRGHTRLIVQAPDIRNDHKKCPLPRESLTEEGMTIIPEKTITPRDLITPRMFTRLTGRIMADSSLDRHTAERILEQALAFLAACARNPGARLAPSRGVDKGWHAFLLFTADYAEFCDRIAGRFIHHLPTEPGAENDEGQSVAATITAMRAAGLHVDTALWNPAPDCTSDCNQCHAGCHDSPHRA